MKNILINNRGGEVMNVDGLWYVLVLDEFGCYDIYSLADSQMFATSISRDWIEHTIELYECGQWCDECKGDGHIQNDDGSVYRCPECNSDF